MLSAQVSQLIERIVASHAGQPVVFDADGTLWRGDVGEDFLRWAIHHQVVGGSYQQYEALLHQSHARAYAYCVEVMAGVEETVIAQRCAEFFAQRFTGRVFPFVRPMLSKLNAAGCPIWICSASPVWNVLPGAELLGIPSTQVIGVHCPLEGGRLTGVVEQPVPVGPGKVAWLQRRGVSPALGVGNGDLDLDMLAFSAHAIVVSPPDSKNHLVAEGERRGWPILSA